MDDQFAPFVEPPYYAVIFTNRHKAKDDKEYYQAADEMVALAKTMPGYLGFESARDESGFGFAISYWRSEEDIARWKRQADHLNAQRRGRANWYEDYVVRIAKVERAYDMKRSGLKSGDE